MKNKILFSIAALVSVMTFSAFAGGEEVFVPPPQAPNCTRFFYVEGNGGYAQGQWHRITDWNGLFTTYDFITDAGAMFGFDAGLIFTRYLGVELGWFYLPRVKGKGANLTPHFYGNVSVNSNFGYAAAKFSVPIYDNTQVFGKIGGADRRFNYQGSAAPVTGTYSYWTPVFGAGVQYLMSSLTLNIQYIRVPSSENVRPVVRRAAAANLYTAGIGYRFNF